MKKIGKAVLDFFRGIGGLVLLALFAVGAVMGVVFRSSPKKAIKKGKAVQELETTVDDIHLADEARRDARDESYNIIQETAENIDNAKDGDIAERVANYRRLRGRGSSRP